jgi:hypothetical protein
MEQTISSPARLVDVDPWLPANATPIGPRAWMITVDEVCSVYVGETLLVQFAPSDKAGGDYAMAQLALCKYATQAEVAQAFGVSARTVGRLCRCLVQSGVSGLTRKERTDKTPGAVAARICALRKRGARVSEIAKRTQVSARTVRTILEERGLSASDRVARQTSLEEVGDPAAVPVVERAAGSAGPAAGEEILEGERAAAQENGESIEDGDREILEGSAGEIAGTEGALGGEESNAAAAVLEEEEKAGGAGEAPALGVAGEVAVQFESAANVAGAGALLALSGSGPLLSAAREVYGKLREGVYGLRATVLGLLLMALLRRKSPEALKGCDLIGMGGLQGLRRYCEVKTLRRKLTEVSAMSKAASWHRAVAKRWVAQDEGQIGVLHIDGHTRAYYGKEKIAKGWCARRRLCQAGTSDTWVNNARGEPLLRVTAEGHPALSVVLPAVVKDVRELIGEQEATVVFDRGGWSGPCFRQVREQGFHFATYLRGKWVDWPEEQFTVQRLGEGEKAEEYGLAEGQMQIQGYGEARLIVWRSKDGKQTPIITSKEETAALEVAQELFGRWQQENYLKYMRAEYSLDALVEYGVDDAADREIPNPQWQAVDRELRKARVRLKALQAKYGGKQLDTEQQKEEGEGKPQRGGEKGLATLSAEIAGAKERVTKLQEQRTALPKRALRSETERAAEKVLRPERKLFIDIIKMAAYRADCDLMRRAAGHLVRNSEEGHVFVRMVLAQPGDLRVTGDLVEVILRPMSAPRYTRALQGICADVNSTDPRFPESPYRLHFSVAGGDQTGQAGPRPCQEF